MNLTWHTGLCLRNDTGGLVFGIRWMEQAPPAAGAGVLASSYPFCSRGAALAIYKNRLQWFLERHPNVQEVALTYILVHELAHVMQGIDRHSDSGIRKAEWSDADCYRMRSRTLAFTAEDVDLIHRGLAARIARPVTFHSICSTTDTARSGIL